MNSPCSPEAMLSTEGIKALAPQQELCAKSSGPSLSFKTSQLQNMLCHSASLLSPTPNLQDPQICFENGHCGFLNMSSSGWGAAGQTQPKHFSKTLLPYGSVFSSCSPTATMKRGSEVMQCDPCCHKGCLSESVSYSSSSYRSCLCFEAFPCSSHPTRAVITSTFRRSISQRSP